MIESMKATMEKLRLKELASSFLMSCGAIFILLNLNSILGYSQYQVYGGFFGHLLLACVCALSATYVRPSKNESQTEN